MNFHFIQYWDRLRASFWFLPAIMALGSMLLAYGAVVFDEEITHRYLSDWRWVHSGGSEGANSLLSTIAGSMITIAGVVFSMTLVSLSLTSSQFGPRLLRNFMVDPVNQVVLGTFIATFLYCLMVLRTIRHGDDAFVPHLAVKLGVVFAILSLGVLIFFIHHIAVSIQADEVVRRVGVELLGSIDRLYPEQIGDGVDPQIPGLDVEHLARQFRDHGQGVCAPRDGYLQYVNAEAILQLARDHDVIVRVDCQPGDYLTTGCILGTITPIGRVDDKLTHKLQEAFIFGDQRTPAQDIEFSVDQLVEIAVRALSPGINDPFTAVRCIDRLGSALSLLAARKTPSAYRVDEDQQLRVVATPVSYSQILDHAFHKIRQYSTSSPSVMIRLLDTLVILVRSTRREEDREALRAHADRVKRAADTHITEPDDLATIHGRYQAVLDTLADPTCRA